VGLMRKRSKGNNTDSVTAIFEVSDLQSKFHTWEGCLNYQSYPIEIDKITYVTIYDQDTNIVNGEIIVASAPTLNQTMVLVYWFDTLKLRTNGTVTDYSVKFTLIRYIPAVNNQPDTAKVEATKNQLLSLSENYEEIWSQFKSEYYGRNSRAQLSRLFAEIRATRPAKHCLAIITTEILRILCFNRSIESYLMYSKPSEVNNQRLIAIKNNTIESINFAEQNARAIDKSYPSIADYFVLRDFVSKDSFFIRVRQFWNYIHLFE